MVSEAKEWDGAMVRTWLESRVAAARADQVTAQRAGRGHEDDCDIANAEETVCAQLKGKAATDSQSAFAAELKALLDRDDYMGRGVYDERRFDRHVRSYIRKLMKMTKTNTGFGNVTHYQ
jgi:predicted RNase H-like nuclease (RuvC/YqgF family)